MYMRPILWHTWDTNYLLLGESPVLNLPIHPPWPPPCIDFVVLDTVSPNLLRATTIVMDDFTWVLFESLVALIQFLRGAIVHICDTQGCDSTSALSQLGDQNILGIQLCGRAHLGSGRTHFLSSFFANKDGQNMLLSCGHFSCATMAMLVLTQCLLPFIWWGQKYGQWQFVHNVTHYTHH